MSAVLFEKKKTFDELEGTNDLIFVRDQLLSAIDSYRINVSAVVKRQRFIPRLFCKHGYVGLRRAQQLRNSIVNANSLSELSNIIEDKIQGSGSHRSSLASYINSALAFVIGEKPSKRCDRSFIAMFFELGYQSLSSQHLTAGVASTACFLM